jgi:hypothetical protein
VVWFPWPTSASAPSHISSSLKPKTRRGIIEILHRLCGEENIEKKKLSGRQKSAREIPSRRREIIAIITIIELRFTGIIIIATSTFITIITTPSHYNILG